jgi:hypothetical protein
VNSQEAGSASGAGRTLTTGNRQSSNSIIEDSYQQLLSWCREHNFAGHDPFDALNSRLFQATPFAKSRNARLLWTQLVKRSPADLRRVASVPPQRNAKGIALFALAQLANHRRSRTAESEAASRALLSELLSMKLDGYSGAAWGYNFDWQSRNFFAPQGTPTIVPTAFAGRALLEAAHEFGDSEYLDTARSICDFILSDLQRPVATDDEICFSYSTTSRTRIYNASLLAAEVLAGVGQLTDNADLLEYATRATRYAINQQSADGSWAYGAEPSQSWVDNFHTAYILFSLYRINQACSPGKEFESAMERGYQYWKDHFFLAEGWPKYYDDDPYPADAHAGASAIITFLELSELDASAFGSAVKIARWTIDNLRDPRGFFYYQRRRFYTVRKPFMRWSQAWMLYALARLLEATAPMSDEL